MLAGASSSRILLNGPSTTLSNLPAGHYEMTASHTSPSGNVVVSPTVSFKVELEGDDFGAPLLLAGTQGQLSADDRAAGVQPHEPIPGPGISGTLWWTWTAPTSGRLLLNASDHPWIGIDCFTGDSLESLIPIETAGPAAGPGQYAFEVVQGVGYRLRSVRTGPGSAFAIPFQLVVRPDHDSWATRRIILGDQLEEDIILGAASLEAGEPNVRTDDSSVSVWYEWTPTRTGTSTLVVRQPDGLASVHVYSDVARTQLVGGTFPGQASQTWSPASPVAYQIQVIGTAGLRAPVHLSFQHTARPDNDDLEEATVLTGLSGVSTVNTAEATVQPGEPALKKTRTLWYRWQAPVTGMLELTVAPGGFFGPVFQVFTSSQTVASFPALAPVEPEYDSPGIFSVQQGKTYYFWVGTQGATPDPTIRLTYAVHQAPANDAFQQRQVLSGIDLAWTASQWAATREVGEPKHAGSSVGRSVWWTWTAPTNGWVTIAAQAVPVESRHQVPFVAAYAGSSLPTLSLASAYAQEDRAGVASFSVQTGKSYQIVLDNPGPGMIGGSPRFYPGADVEMELHFTTLKLVAPTENQIIVSPAPVVFEINTPSFAQDGRILGVTYVVGQPGNPAGVGSHPQTGPAPFRVTLENHPKGTFVVLAVATNEQGLVRISPPVTFTHRPSNDAFATRAVLDGRQGAIDGTLEAATREAGEPSTPSFPQAVSVWYSWKAPSSGILTIDSNEAGEVALYTGTALGQLTRHSANVNTQYAGTPAQVTRDVTYAIAVRNRLDIGSRTVPFHLRWALRSVVLSEPADQIVQAEGSTIRMRADVFERRSDFGGVRFLVDGAEVAFSQASSSPFIQNWNTTSAGLHKLHAEVLLSSGLVVSSLPITVRVRPAYDSFATRKVLTGINPKIVGTTTGSDVIGNQKSCWYRWQAPAEGLLRLSTTNRALAIGVWSGISFSNLVALEELNQRASGAVPGDSRFHVQAGVEYAIQIGSSGFESGTDFQVALEFHPVPSNDLFEARAVLPSEPGRYVISTVSAFATTEPNEPEHGLGLPWHSVWWGFTPTKRGAIRITGDDFGHTLSWAGYEGATLGNLTRLPLADHAAPSEPGWWEVQPGVEYKIAVDSVIDMAGPFSLGFEYVESSANDAFDARLALQGMAASSQVNTFGAGREPGEPAHLNMPDGASLWWTWTAEDDGTAHIAVTEHGIVSGMSCSIYQGGQLSELRLVAAAERSVPFRVQRGQRYEIAVDVYRGFRAFLDLDLKLILDEPVPLPPANDRFEKRSRLTGTSVSIRGSNRSASREWHEPLHAANFGGRSVWYSWTAPRSGLLNARLTGSLVKLFAVYRGTQVDALAALASRWEYGSEATLEIPVRSGQEYQIAVDGWLGQVGTFDLQLALDPTQIRPEVALQSGSSDGLRLTISGLEGRTARLETSSDLVTWVPLQMIVPESPTSPVDLTVPRESNPEARFFRVVITP